MQGMPYISLIYLVYSLKLTPLKALCSPFAESPLLISTHQASLKRSVSVAQALEGDPADPATTSK